MLKRKMSSDPLGNISGQNTRKSQAVARGSPSPQPMPVHMSIPLNLLISQQQQQKGMVSTERLFYGSGGNSKSYDTYRKNKQAVQ